MICTTTQGFYDNAANAYASLGMKGHGGEDINCGFGSPIECILDGTVINILDDQHPASDGYWGIYTLCQYKGVWGELCVGHCSRIDVKVGDKVTKGQIIGAEGNHGYVFQDGVQITLAQQAAGDERGHHRHWQWRPLIQTRAYLANTKYLANYDGIFQDSNGFYYEIADYENGFHGLSPDIATIISDYETGGNQNLQELEAKVADATVKTNALVEAFKKFFSLFKK